MPDDERVRTLTRPGRRVVDGRARLELAGLFVLTAVTLGVAASRIVRNAEQVAALGASGVLIACGIGVLAGAGAVALAIRTWRRGGGRPAQRLGRRAWRTGALPESAVDRVLALRDLQRRERLLSGGGGQVFVAVVWLLIAASHLIGAGSATLWDLAPWVLLAGLAVAHGGSEVHDRRRLPALRALLRSDAPRT